MEVERAEHGRVVVGELESSVAGRSLAEHAEGPGRTEAAESKGELHDARLVVAEVDGRRVGALRVDPVARSPVVERHGLDLEAEFADARLVTFKLLTHGRVAAVVRTDLSRTLGRRGELVDDEVAYDLLLGDRLGLRGVLQQEHQRDETFTTSLELTSNTDHRAPSSPRGYRRRAPTHAKDRRWLRKFVGPQLAEGFLATPRARTATRLLPQRHLFNGHRAVVGLAHVVDRQRRHRHGDQCLHLDASAVDRVDARLD